MPQTRANKVTVPTNSDAWNLTGDLATMADSSNLVIPVASQTERDALTKAAGLTVSRTDLPGAPLQTCDGTGWSILNGLPILTNTPHTGSGTGLLGNLQTGAARAYIQSGSNTVTPDVNGYASIVMPTTYPNGVIAQLVTNGDNSISNGQRLLITLGTAAPSTSQLHIRVWDTGANAAYTSITRVEWIAIGW